jgi:DNA repair exonuclease SbcCD ATPase subunit
MKSPKQRDLAQELVEFLLKEEEQKKDGAGKGGDNKVTHATATIPLQSAKTHVLASPVNEKATVKGASQANIEFDLDLGDGVIPDINFSSPGPLAQKPVEIVDEKPKSEKPKIEKIQAEPPVEKKVSEKKVEPIRPLKSGNEPKFSDQSKHRTTSGRENLIFNEVNALAGGAEAIRVAQARITSLENERDQLRDETEKLLSATESLQRQVFEIRANQENLERRFREKIEILEEEKVVLKSRLAARETELDGTKKGLEELQARFQNDLRKVRVRERELENRQELMKAETEVIIRSKDEMILELRRQLEQLHFELDNFRAKSADLNSKIGEFHDRNHRTVKALRLALTVLEIGDDDTGKKTG